MENYQEFYRFMSDYADFFGGIMEKEERKMKALYSRDLDKLEIILKEHQETEKKVEELEKKRLELHKRLGIENKTFKEIISEESGSEKTSLREVYSRLCSFVSSTKHYNEKSLEFARINLDIVEEIKTNGIADAQCYDMNGITSFSAVKKPTFFNTKI